MSEFPVKPPALTAEVAVAGGVAAAAGGALAVLCAVLVSFEAAFVTEGLTVLAPVQRNTGVCYSKLLFQRQQLDILAFSRALLTLNP